VDELLRHEETLLSALSPLQREELTKQLRILLASLNPEPSGSGEYS
jgi:hypothetical protein